MAKNYFNVILNKEAVRSLLRSSEMMSVCKEKAEGIQQRAGEGYAVSEYQGVNRVNVSVYTDSYEAMKDNSENETLLKSLR
jgi:hypothetical protein